MAAGCMTLTLPARMMKRRPLPLAVTSRARASFYASRRLAPVRKLAQALLASLVWMLTDYHFRQAHAACPLWDESCF